MQEFMNEDDTIDTLPVHGCRSRVSRLNGASDFVQCHYC